MKKETLLAFAFLGLYAIALLAGTRFLTTKSVDTSPCETSDCTHSPPSLNLARYSLYALFIGIIITIGTYMMHLRKSLAQMEHKHRQLKTHAKHSLR